MELAASEKMQVLRKLNSRDGMSPDNAGSGIEQTGRGGE